MPSQLDLLASERAMQRICAKLNGRSNDFDKLAEIRSIVDRWVDDPKSLANELGNQNA